MSGGAVGAWTIQPLTGIGVGGRPVRRTHRGDAATSRPLARHGFQARCKRLRRSADVALVLQLVLHKEEPTHLRRPNWRLVR